MDPCLVRRLGRLGYAGSMDLQRDHVRRRIADGIPDTLLLLEHPPVITLGKMSRREHILGDDIEIVETDRGGDVTYHGPGQIVGYPILKLEDHDVKRYVERLEEVMIRAAAVHGVTAGRIPGFTGAWVGDAKIGAIGVRVERWVTSHGFAFNVQPDLGHFARIVPCGIRGKSVTSLAALLGHPVDVNQVLHDVAHAFGEVFRREIVFEGAAAPS